MNQFCTQCGHQNEADSRFCDACGAPLTSRPVSQETGPARPAARGSWFLVTAVIVLLLAAGVFVAAVLVPSSPAPAILAQLGIRLPSFESSSAARATIYPVREHGKWGFVDRAGNVVIPMQFEDIKNQENGDGVTTADLIAVRTGGLWGFVDRSGRFVIAPKFGDVDHCYVHQLYDDPKACDFFREGLTPVRMGQKWGYIDGSGKYIIEPQFDEARGFTPGGLAIVKVGRWLGFIDKTGAYVIPPRFVFADIVSGSLLASDELHHGNIDRIGNFIINYATLGLGATQPPWSEGLLAAGRTDGNWGFINEKGQMVIPAIYQEANKFSERKAAAKLNNLWGFIGHSGQFEIQPKFDYVDDFRQGRAIVGIATSRMPSRSLLGVEQLYGVNPKFGVIDTSGNFVVKPQFDMITKFMHGLSAVSVGNKWGYIDDHGNVVIALEFDAAQPFFGEIARVKRNGKMQRIDKTGRVIWREVE